MTYEESHFCTDGCMYGEDECGRVLDEVIKALEKQIPKKPKILHFWSRCEMSCPNCDTNLISKDTTGITIGNKVNFCENCGQAIDWSDV